MYLWLEIAKGFKMTLGRKKAIAAAKRKLNTQRKKAVNAGTNKFALPKDCDVHYALWDEPLGTLVKRIGSKGRSTKIVYMIINKYEKTVFRKGKRHVMKKMILARIDDLKCTVNIEDRFMLRYRKHEL